MLFVFRTPMNPLRLSNSSVGRFHSCPRKFEFTKILRVDGYEESQAAAGGTALHEAWYEYLRTGNKKAAFWALIRHYPIHLQQNHAYNWDLTACYSALHSLITHPYLEGYELAEVNGAPAIEIPFEIRFPGVFLDAEKTIPISYIGYIDNIFNRRRDMAFVVLDIKNTTRKFKDLEVVYKFDPQMLPYALVLEAILQDRISELNCDYLVTFVDVEEPYTRHLEFTKSLEDIQSWAQEMALFIRELQIFYASKHPFPRRSSACVSFNRACSFFSICDASADYIASAHPPQEDTHADQFEPVITVDLELEGLV